MGRTWSARLSSDVAVAGQDITIDGTRGVVREISMIALLLALSIALLALLDLGVVMNIPLLRPSLIAAAVVCPRSRSRACAAKVFRIRRLLHPLFLMERRSDLQARKG